MSVDQRSLGSVPIKFHILFHPGSVAGRIVAHRLFHRFVEPPLSGGLRVPILFTPDLSDGLPPDPATLVNGDADRTLVIILSDAVMMRRVEGGTGDDWSEFYDVLVRQASSKSDELDVLPFALDERGFDLTHDRHMIGASLSNQLSEVEAVRRQISRISFFVATHGLKLLRGEHNDEVPPGQVKAPISMFLSHAKRDISENPSDPVHQTLHSLSDLPVEHWFDSAKINASEAFSEAIEGGIRDATIVVAFQTDHFDSRAWCRREVLTSKRLGAHLLVVSALVDEVPRQFPYLGNVPIVQWRGDDPKTNAHRVIDRAVLEAFRLTHNRKILEIVARADDIVLAAAPEALTLAVTPPRSNGDKRVFLYPDPPLDKDELEVLKALSPKDSFETPLTRLVEDLSGLNALPISMSISTPDSLADIGMSESHLRALTDEMHLHLLLAGLSLVYGGALNADTTDPQNFTSVLFELAHGYSPLAATLDSTIRPILNVPPWPLHKAYSDEDLALFGNIADLERGPDPDLPWDISEIFPTSSSGWRFAANTPNQRYAWTKGLTAARLRISEISAANVVVAGKLTGFAGIVPGVVEEAHIALRSGKPLYLVGAFGGAAGALVDQMFRSEPSAALLECGDVPQLQDTLELFDTYGGLAPCLHEICEFMRGVGRLGPAAALKNGLSDEENVELFQSLDARRIAELIMTGLTRTIRTKANL